MTAYDARTAPSDTLGETVEKLREAVAALASVRMEISLERWGQLSSDILAAADLLTALEQRGDGRAISDPTRRMERILDAKFTPRSTPLPTKED